MDDLDDYLAFGLFLTEAREKVGKTITKLELEIGTKSVSGWHNHSCLPLPVILPAIAVAYGLDLADLTRRFDKATDHRKMLKASRRRYIPKIFRDNEAKGHGLPSHGPFFGRTHSR